MDMLNRWMIICLVLSLPVFAQAQIEQEFQGIYEGEVPAYSTFINDQEISIGAQNITIEIQKDKITYQATDGSPLKGTYEVIKDKRKESEIEAEVSNGRSLKLELYLILDKKKKVLKFTSNSDQPETTLKFTGDSSER